MHNEQGTGLTTPPSASVFIRHIKDSPVVDMISGIRETTARAVPGLDISNVSVVLETFKENVVITAPRRSSSPSSDDYLIYVLIAVAASGLTAIGFFAKDRFGKKNVPEADKDGKS